MARRGVGIVKAGAKCRMGLRKKIVRGRGGRKLHLCVRG